MKRFVSSAIALLLASSACAAATGPSIAYKVAPSFSGSVLKGLAVELRFKGDADGSTAVILPEGDGLRPLGTLGAVRIVGGKRVGDGRTFSIEHRKGADVELHYVIRPPAPAAGGQGNLAPAGFTVEPNRFATPAGLVLASLPERRSEQASFSWGAFPRSWKLISDLEASPSFRLDMFNHGMLIGGTDMRLLETGSTVNKAPFALHPGKLGFSAEEMAQYVGKAINASAAYWGTIAPDILTTIVPVVGQADFRFAWTTDDLISLWVGAQPDFATLRAHMAHEVMHTFVPTSIGNHPYGVRAYNWLGEGLNDFYSFRVMLWGDVWSWDTFALETNKVLGAYAVSSMRNAPADVVNEAPMSNEVRLLAYQQGHLLGLLWDYRIRQATGGKASMNDVARRMIALAKSDPSTPTVDNFRKAYAEASGGLTIDEDFARHVAKGETIRLPADIFGKCGRIVDEERIPYDRGFASLDGQGIVGRVDRSGPAFAAGIRDGMRLVERVAGLPGNSALELALRVSDANGEKVVRYMPRGRAVTAQKIVPSTGADAQQCARDVSARQGRA